MTQATRIRTCPRCKKKLEQPHYNRDAGAGCWIALGVNDKTNKHSWLRVWKPNG